MAALTTLETRGTADSDAAAGSRRDAVGFVALMGALAALGPVSSDIYLPSLPAVATDLGTTVAATQFTISGVLLGAAVGQLIVGPLSDRWGRRRPALLGIGLHVVASLLCMLAPSIGVLIALRVVQGMGNSAAAVTAMAVIRDRLRGGPAARALSRLVLVISLAPLFAPSIGGLIAGAAGWRAVFAALAIFGLALWVVVWRFLPETLPVERRTSRAPGTGQSYRVLLGDRPFLSLAVLPGLALASIMSYVAAAPFVLQQGFGLTEHQFAALFALNGASGMVTSQVNASLVRRRSPMAILRVALPSVVGLATLLLMVAHTGWGGLAALTVALWLLLGSLMFVGANATAMALSLHGERAGSAAALLGALQTGVAAAVSPVVGLLGGDATAMALTILGAQALALLILALLPGGYWGRRADVADSLG